MNGKVDLFTTVTNLRIHHSVSTIMRPFMGREDLVILAGLGKVYDNLWYRPKNRGLGYILPGCNTVQNSKPGIAKIGWLDLYPPPPFLAIPGFWKRLLKPSIPNSSLVDLTAMTLAKEDDYSLHFVLPSSRVMAEEYRVSEVEFWSKLGAKVTCDMA